MVLDESDLKVLADMKRKRGVVKASLTRIKTFVSKFDPREQAVSLLEFRQEELPLINRKFDDIQSQIELLSVDEDVQAEEDRANFEQDYFSIRSKIQELINLEKSHNTSTHNSTFLTGHHAQRMQLTPIPLPSFNGNIQDWFSFFDIFKAMVHNEDGYTPAQKFFHLRSCLRGTALDLVQSIPISDVNYDVVIKRLIQRYDNKSLVIQSHIRSILDCSPVDESVPNSLQKLNSTVCTHVAALKSLNQPVEYWDAWLITIVTGLFDRNTAHSWQLYQKNTDLPKYADLEAYLANRCAVLETLAFNKQPTNTENVQGGSSVKKSCGVTNSKKALFATDSKPSRPCPCCSEMHRMYMCQKFKNLSISERLDVVRDNRLCFNCLAPFHTADNCKSSYSCKKCHRKHNTILHFERKQEDHQLEDQPSNAASLPEPSSIQSPRAKSMMSVVKPKEVTHVFLATAIVSVRNKFGVYRKCRAVLDSGSQVNFISKRFAKLLQLPSRKTIMPISGIGASTTQSTNTIDAHMKSCIRNFGVNISCYILPVIVEELPSVKPPKEGWQIPKDYESLLADPSFCEAGPIDLLLGCGIFFDLMEAERTPLAPGTLCLQASKLGWLVTGGIQSTCLLSVGESLENRWRDQGFAEDNDYGRLSKANRRCTEEQEAAAHFQKTMKRDEDGRFVLRLPIKHEISNIGKTLDMATARFLSVERRLQRDESLGGAYVTFMKEYEANGHMKEVDNSSTPTTRFYLPHHPVLKESSLTTKLRVVFDASAKSSTGVSLNDILMRGPTVQEELFAILARFRKHQYAITSDVEKMFRQISVDPEDQDLQCILWREKPSDSLRTFKLTTVTYGTTSASFMATQCLVSLAEIEKNRYPEAASAIRRDFYMDDLMTGAETIAGCIQLQTQISSILSSARLPLRKWCSNSDEILAHVVKEQREPLFVIRAEAEDVVKSLGLCWKPVLDEFIFQLASIPIRAKVTKRMLLSDLNKIFDPLGFLTPVLITGKIFLQQLWQIKIEWDNPLPIEIQTKWELFHQQLEELGSLSIPRKCKPCVSEHIEFHGFCDASQEAYGACIYVRSQGIDDGGQVYSRLLCSKSRVAPLKGSTIPRLELSGALVLAQLAVKVALAWDVDVKCFHLWTDSTVVLGWINSHVTRLKTFVANRVEQILEITDPKQWRYVKTEENPADLVSRGVKPHELDVCSTWWNGPVWLSQARDQWKVVDTPPQDTSELPEQRLNQLALLAVNPLKDIVTKYSTWNRLLRAVAWILRFVKYIISKRQAQETSYLSVQDLREAENFLIRRAQAEEFGEEIKALKNQKEIPHSSKLQALNPVIRNELLVVGGRLTNADISEEQKRPIVLPADHTITQLIFKDRHRNLLHVGPQALLADIRRRYWPLRGRMIARSVVKQCVTCIRAKPSFQYPLMAPLPKDRVICSRPFTTTGVDFAGPLTIRSGIRGRPGKKAWVAMFICFATKAIHIEVVEELTKNAFIAALRRFSARRGKPATIWSDNGTNFVGAQRELSAYTKNIEAELANEGISWRFNPPSSPHFGGLWEASVKSAKHHLNRVMKQACLTLSELQTLLCQIEACLNSRPLTPLSSDPNDLESLTPAHFLIGGPITLPPEPDLSEDNMVGLRRWKLVQGILQTFWNRWRNEYLPQLQVRGKWRTKREALKVADIVIVKEDNLAPTKWKIARVTNLHPGKDGHVRVVTIRTSNGTEMRRPVIKLCHLPVLEGEQTVGN